LLPKTSRSKRDTQTPRQLTGWGGFAQRTAGSFLPLVYLPHCYICLNGSTEMRLFGWAVLVFARMPRQVNMLFGFLSVSPIDAACISLF